MVLIAIIVVGVLFAFLFMTVIAQFQTATEHSLAASQWASGDWYMAYYYATTFVTSLWQYIIVIILLIAAYWIYIYSQRRSAGY